MRAQRGILRAATAASFVVVVAFAPWASGAPPRDGDRDGMPSAWERHHGLDPSNPRDAHGDPDRDKLGNLLEYEHHGDPHERDTDADGLRDGSEVKRWQSPVDVPNQLIGHVQVAGWCPKSRRRHPCAVRNLFSINVVVRNARGKILMQTTSLLNGRFAFQHLSPGHYRLEAVAVAGTSAPAPLDAIVPRNPAGPTAASFTFADSNDTGVVGQATQSPTCGGPQRAGEDCVAPLSGAQIEVHEGDADGSVVASTTTRSDGHYAFRLEPGTYTLVAQPFGDASLPAPPAPTTFTVFSDDNGPNVIDSDYDTGIR